MRIEASDMSRVHIEKARRCVTAMVSGLVRAADLTRLLAPQIMTMIKQVFESGPLGCTTAMALAGREQATSMSVRAPKWRHNPFFGAADVERLFPAH